MAKVIIQSATNCRKPNTNYALNVKGIDGLTFLNSWTWFLISVLFMLQLQSGSK